METLYEPLAAILNESSFEMQYGKGDGAKRRMSAEELHEIYGRPEEQAVDRRAHLLAPSRLLAQLVDALRLALEPFIDPDTNQVGHAFPIDIVFSSRSTFRAGGHCDTQFTSSLPNFATALVQAAAIIGVEDAVRLLADWIARKPVRIQLSTVLNNLPLVASVSPRDDIHVVPLALTTTQLPRVPLSASRSAKDFLGLTMLKLDLSASPALFRPSTQRRDQIVRISSSGGIDLDLVCEALSLQANRHVAGSLVWHDYPDAAAFRFGICDVWSHASDRLESRSRKSERHEFETGAVTIVPADEPLQRLDQDELGHTLKALEGADRKLRIAIHRWRRSKLPYAKQVDAYIDLRVALEALYLKDFTSKYSGELRFRLALTGAWHLAADLDERRSILRTLRDAYDTASAAVHTGEIKDEHGANLSDAQDVCRRGILKLLLEGPPHNWGDLVLGAEALQPPPAGDPAGGVVI